MRDIRVFFPVLLLEVRCDCVFTTSSCVCGVIFIFTLVKLKVEDIYYEVTHQSVKNNRIVAIYSY